MTETRKLRVFLCHSSQDKPIVRELYRRLNDESWIDPWLDKEKLFPGQEWELEIEKSVEISDAVIVCLSKNSIGKEGYFQKEIKKVLDLSDQKPEGDIFIIPLRLDDCQPPARLVKWQYVDYFSENLKNESYQKLRYSLKLTAKKLGIFKDMEETGKFDIPIASMYKANTPLVPKSYYQLNKPCFVTRSGDVIEFPRDKEMITVGREDNSIGNTPDISLADRSVSRLHATIYFRDGAYFLQSLITATNGTFVNGEIVKNEMKEINNKDLIEFGEFELTFYK